MSTSSHAVPSPGSRRWYHAPAFRWLLAGAATCAVVAALTLALWPASAADTAYDDGQRLGQAVSDLRNADTYDEVDNGLTDVRNAAADARDHAGDELDSQITAQGDALSRALNGFTGAATSGDDWDQELYESELDVAVDDLAAQADDFRTNAPEVTRSFYEGLQAGLES
jgi:hypothetical protein